VGTTTGAAGGFLVLAGVLFCYSFFFCFNTVDRKVKEEVPLAKACPGEHHSFLVPTIWRGLAAVKRKEVG